MSAILKNNLPILGTKIRPSPRLSDASPHRNVTNPGDTQPHSQQFIAPEASRGTSVTYAPGSITTSDGQYQQLNASPPSNGVTVTRMKGGTSQENGEIQIPIGKRKIDQGVRAIRTHKGLAENIHAGSQGFSTPIQSYAKPLPLSVEVHAGNNRPGGLPRNIMIK
jgi:hypothetical protein